MKRFLAVVLAVAMVAAFVPAARADDGEFDLTEIAADVSDTGPGWTKDPNTITITHDGPITLSGNSGILGVNVGTATSITLAAGTAINALAAALTVPGGSIIHGQGPDITITGVGHGIVVQNGDLTISGTIGAITSSSNFGIFTNNGSVTISGTTGDITGGITGINAGFSGVTISGTVGKITAKNGDGISAGSVTISGEVGVISGSGDGIYVAYGTFTISNNSVVYASNLMKWDSASNGFAPASPSANSNGILFIGEEGREVGTVYGNVTLKDNLTIEDGQTLTVPVGATLTVPNGVTLTNNGEIENDGTIYSDSEIAGVTTVPLPKTPETSEISFFAYFEPTPPAPPVSDADTPSDWAKEAVEMARKLGLIPEHLDGSWRRWLNRAEFAAFAVLLYEHLDGRAITAWSLFDDTTDTNVEKLAGLGIVKGDGTGNFDPNGNFSREMALTLMYNILVRLGYYLPPSEPTFSDADSISPWAREAVGALQRAGIVKGDGTRFNAQETFSREMGVVTMAQILEWVG